MSNVHLNLFCFVLAFSFISMVVNPVLFSCHYLSLPLCGVFVVKWQGDLSVMAYVPLITSFLIVWIETWFLDFKVLPQEQSFREAWGMYCIFLVLLLLIHILFIHMNSYVVTFIIESSFFCLILMFELNSVNYATTTAAAVYIASEN